MAECQSKFVLINALKVDNDPYNFHSIMLTFRYCFILVLLVLISSTTFQPSHPVQERLTHRFNNLFSQAISQSQLRAHGLGVSEEQELLVQGYILEATKVFPNDLFNNALLIQDRIEKSGSFESKWSVEIMEEGGQKERGFAVEISNEQWIIFTKYGPYQWSYLLWVSYC